MEVVKFLAGFLFWSILCWVLFCVLLATVAISLYLLRDLGEELAAESAKRRNPIKEIKDN